MAEKKNKKKSDGKLRYHLVAVFVFCDNGYSGFDNILLESNNFILGDEDILTVNRTMRERRGAYKTVIIGDTIVQKPQSSAPPAPIGPTEPEESVESDEPPISLEDYKTK